MAKEYLLDGNVVSWQMLIKTAEDISDGYQKQSFKTTSEAASILRQDGHTVSDNYEH